VTCHAFQILCQYDEIFAASFVDALKRQNGTIVVETMAKKHSAHKAKHDHDTNNNVKFRETDFVSFFYVTIVAVCLFTH